MDTSRPIVQALLQRFVDTYVRQLSGLVLGRYFIRGDQTAFREALYYFRNSIKENIQR